MATLKKIIEWMNEGHDGWQPLGIREILETDERTSGYRDKPHCRVKDDKNSKLYVRVDHEQSVGHYWVWQTVGMMGDDYSGYLLLPLSKGKYLHVSYSC